MPRTGLSPEEIRSKAIDLTIQRMRSDGFDKVRLVDVAKAIGVSHVVLYNHFANKSALLEAVTERWLNKIDDELEKICQSKQDPIVKIHSWFKTLHRMKVEKVRNDPELYKSFDIAAEDQKTAVIKHLRTNQCQMVGLVNEAIANKKIRKANPEQTATILRESMVAFSHPKIVVQRIDEEREPLLKQTLDVVLRGLK